MENQNNDMQSEVNEKQINLTNFIESVDVLENGPRKVKQNTEQRNAIIDQFPIFAFASLLYAVVYTFCMYENLCGIASSVLVIGSIGYIYFILKKLGYEFRKKHIIYGVIVVLLGANLFFTMDPFLHFVDYVAIILVIISGVFSVIYDTKGWDLGDSMKAILSHLFGAMGNIFDIGYDWSKYAKNKDKKTGIGTYIAIGIIVTVPVLAVVLALLSGADAVFGNMISGLFDDIEFGDIIGIGFVFVGALLGVYSWLTFFVNDYIKVNETDKRTKEPVVLIVVGVALGLVYLLFCGIQVVYLFAGIGELPKGYTYATYAREGFSQLMFVCLINLVFVLIGVKYFKENTVLKVILTVITGCTYLMVVSSAYRMYMYVSVYQMSLLRIWVLWTLVWLSFILTGALITVYNKKFSLFMYSMIVTSVLYIAFAYARPAYIVASYNLSDCYEQDKIDYAYLRYDINEDATGPILKYYENADDENKAKIVEFFATNKEIEKHKTTIRNYNISRTYYYKQKMR